MSNKVEIFYPKNQPVVCEYTATNIRKFAQIWLSTRFTKEILINHAYKKFLESLEASLPIAKNLATENRVQLQHLAMPLNHIVLIFLEEKVSYYLLHNPEDTDFEETWQKTKIELALYYIQPRIDQSHPFFQFIKELETKLKRVDLPTDDLTYLFKSVIPAWLTNPNMMSAELFQLYDSPKRPEPPSATINLPFSSLFQTAQKELQQLELAKRWLFPYIQKRLNELESMEPNWDKLMHYFLEDNPKAACKSPTEMKKWLIEFQNEWESSLGSLLEIGDQYDSVLVKKAHAFFKTVSGAEEGGELQLLFPDTTIVVGNMETLLDSKDNCFASGVTHTAVSISDEEKKAAYEALLIRQELYALTDTFLSSYMNTASHIFDVLLTQSTAFQKAFSSPELQGAYLSEKLLFPAGPVKKDYSLELMGEPSSKKKKKKKPAASIKPSKEDVTLVSPIPVEKKIEIKPVIQPRPAFDALVLHGKNRLSSYKDTQQLCLGQALWHLENLDLLNRLSFEKEDRLNAVTSLVAHSAWALEQLYDWVHPTDKFDPEHTHNLKLLHQAAFNNHNYPIAIKQFYLGNHWPRFFYEMQARSENISSFKQEIPPVLSLLLKLDENPKSLTDEEFEQFVKESLMSVFQAASELLKFSSHSDRTPLNKIEKFQVSPELLKGCNALVRAVDLQLQKMHYHSRHPIMLMLRQGFASLKMLDRSLSALKDATSYEELSFWIQRSLFLTHEALERTLQGIHYLKKGALLENSHEIQQLSDALKLGLDQLGKTFHKAHQKTRYPLQTQIQTPLADLVDRSQTLRRFPELDQGFSLIGQNSELWLMKREPISAQKLLISLENILKEAFAAFDTVLLPALKK